MFCAGEVLNPPAWEWLQKEVFEDRVPVIDHMWQTETGGPIFGNPYGIALLPIKPGSAGIPLPGIDADVVDARGRAGAARRKGHLGDQAALPRPDADALGRARALRRDYWERIPGVYFTGDAAHVDEDGYVWFGGRADEIIKIAGHRIGTIEVETALPAPPGRRRGRRHRPARRAARRGHLAPSSCSSRATSRPRSCGRSCSRPCAASSGPSR